MNAQDWHLMRGEPRIARLMAPAVFRPRSPRDPVRGTDLAGVVVASGHDGVQWKPGDRVFGQGRDTFAEHVLARANQLAALPPGLDVEAPGPLSSRTPPAHNGSRNHHLVHITTVGCWSTQTAT